MLLEEYCFPVHAFSVPVTCPSGTHWHSLMYIRLSLRLYEITKDAKYHSAAQISEPFLDILKGPSGIISLIRLSATNCDPLGDSALSSDYGLVMRCLGPLQSSNISYDVYT